MAVTLSEQEFQERVLGVCRYRNLLSYHTHDSRRSGPGFPDLVIVGNRVIYRELKTDTGRPSVEQRLWIDRLRTAGADAAIWRPRQWDDVLRQLQELAR